MLGLLGKAPDVGDRATVGNIVLTVERVEGRRIISVMVALLDQDQEQHIGEEVGDA